MKDQEYELSLYKKKKKVWIKYLKKSIWLFASSLLGQIAKIMDKI